MNKFKIIKINILALLILALYFSATDCDYYYLSSDCKPAKSDGYKTYSMSTGTDFKVGQKLEFNMTLMGKKSYIISVCTEDEYSPLNFKIFDKSSRNLIYNNFADDYSSSIGFKSNNPCNIIVTVNSLHNQKKMAGKETCVGVHVQYKNIKPSK